MGHYNPVPGPEQTKPYGAFSAERLATMSPYMREWHRTKRTHIRWSWFVWRVESTMFGRQDSSLLFSFENRPMMLRWKSIRKAYQCHS